MVRVTIATVDERKSVMAPETSSVKQVLDDNQVTHQMATLMIDGIILDAVTVNKTLAELGVTDECTIAVTVKIDNA